MADNLNIHHQLISQCQDGNQAAQFRLYSLYAKAMLNVAYRITNRVEEAEDVLQEAFLKAFKNLHTYEHTATFGAWLKRIVINTAIDHMKKERKVQWERLEVVNKPLIEENTEDDLDLNIQMAQKALQALPNGYRTVLTLYLIEGYDHKEIAAILDISISTSLTQYSRAKQKLKSIIQQMRQNGSARSLLS